MASMTFSLRSISSSTSLVALHEIFDICHHPTTADFREREELPNKQICFNLPNGLYDWEGLMSALAAEGMEIAVKGDKVCISGYASRNDDNYQTEITKIVAKYQRRSQILQGALENEFWGRP